MKNPSRLASFVASVTIMSAACSAPEKTTSPQTCETRAGEFERILDDVHTLLIAASMYIEIARTGTPSAIKDAQELRPKIQTKLSDMKDQEQVLKHFCPKQYSEPSELSNVPRYALRIASIQKRIRDLGGYLNAY